MAISMNEYCLVFTFANKWQTAVVGKTVIMSCVEATLAYKCWYNDEPVITDIRIAGPADEEFRNFLEDFKRLLNSF